MPRGVRNPLPDLSEVDPAELQFEVLSLLEVHFGPRTRNLMPTQFSALLDAAGGARRVLAQALARLRQREASDRVPATSEPYRIE
jgi:hypothetical protein